MHSKLIKLKEERESIINSYSKNKPMETSVEKLAKKSSLREVIVKEIKKETADTSSFILVSKDKTALPTFLPGQYISLHLNVDGITTSRAYTLCSTPLDASKGMYKIAVKRVRNGLVSNYMLDELKENDILEVSEPSGDFYYNELTDEKNVIGIAGGSGITPFMSLANSVESNYFDFNLTVIYSVKTENDIIFKKEIEEINKKSKKVKFIITLTRENNDKYLNGHINKLMLEPYIQEFNSVFMCGPKELYKSMNEILSEFNIPRKKVHYENFFMEYTPTINESYTLKIKTRNEEISIPCRSDETLLVSMEKEGIKAPSMCRVGECGFCRSILVEGQVKMVGGKLTKAENENSYIHPCISYPESDIILKLDI